MRGPSLLGQRATFGTRRWFLWALLVGLIAAVLVMLVWLAGRYEESQVQDRLDRDATDAVSDLRSALVRNVESLQALHARNPAQPDGWALDAAGLLHEHRELLRLEWRDTAMAVVAHADTVFRAPVFDRLGRNNAQSDVALACTNAQRASGPAYSPSYYVAQSVGLGLEVMELCIPLNVSGALSGYLVASYSLSDVLTELIPFPAPKTGGPGGSFTPQSRGLRSFPTRTPRGRPARSSTASSAGRSAASWAASCSC